MTDPGTRLTLTDVARMAEVGISAVSNWRKRHRDFPQPLVEGGQEFFSSSALAHWLQGRKIAKNVLKDGEPPGTTYLDRFVRNGGQAPRTVPPLAVEEDGGAEEAMSMLWKLMDLLRRSHDPSSATGWISRLLYVKAMNGEQWASLREAHGPDALRSALDKVTVPMQPDGQERLFSELMSQAGVDDPALFKTIHTIDRLPLDGNRGPTSLAARLYEGLLEASERRSSAWGGRYTPASLTRCLVGLFEYKQGASVHDPYCGLGELLAALPANGDGQNFRVSGQVSNDQVLPLIRMNLAVHGVDAEIRRGGTIPEDDAFSGERFDYIITNPPFNVPGAQDRTFPWPFGEPPKNNTNFAWLQQVFTKLAPEGRAAVLMPTATTTVGGREGLIRKEMVEAGVVECVIKLPDRLFGTTTIAPTVWVLHKTEKRSSRRVLFIDASRMGDLLDRSRRHLRAHEVRQITDEYLNWSGSDPQVYQDKIGFAESVTLKEIGNHDYLLDPSTHVPQKSDDTASAQQLLESIRKSRLELTELTKHLNVLQFDLDRHLDSITGARSFGELFTTSWANVELGEVCEILTGPGAISRDGSDASRTALVLPRNIQSGRVDRGEVDTVTDAVAQKFERYRLRVGDIVCARAGTLGRYGLVGVEETGRLVGPGCMRIRPGRGVEPTYLVHYLNGTLAYEWLMRHATGSAIKHISAGGLGKLPVRLPPFEAQHQIAEVLDVTGEQVSVHRRAVERTEALRDAVLPFLITRAREGGR